MLPQAGVALGMSVTAANLADGKIVRKDAIAKIMRGNELIGQSAIESLKIVKDEKSEIAKGYECGIKLKENIDFQENDILECYVKEVVKRD